MSTGDCAIDLPLFVVRGSSAGDVAGAELGPPNVRQGIETVARDGVFACAGGTPVIYIALASLDDREVCGHPGRRHRDKTIRHD